MSLAHSLSVMDISEDTEGAAQREGASSEFRTGGRTANEPNHCRLQSPSVSSVLRVDRHSSVHGPSDGSKPQYQGGERGRADGPRE
jgi:hypothetical protein